MITLILNFVFGRNMSVKVETSPALQSEKKTNKTDDYSVPHTKQCGLLD